MLLELNEALKSINMYINQQPPKYDVKYWVKVRKRLRNRKMELEEFIHNGELNIEPWYSEEAVRAEIKDYLIKQGVFKNDSND